MAHDQRHNTQTDQTQTPQSDIVETITLSGQSIVTVPDTGFIKDANLLRSGQDLVLEAPDGTAIIIEDYFSAMPAPAIRAPTGETLTPELVQSFVTLAAPRHYAEQHSLNDTSPAGSVETVDGNATVTRADGSVNTITPGMKIYQGDIIETTGSGAVNIVFIDDTAIAVSQNARLAIDEYVFDPSSNSGNTEFSILRGLFLFTSGLIGREDPDDVEIDTPLGSIGIRGTVIAGNLETGEITVLEGAIVLRGFNGREITLADRFATGRFDPAGGDARIIGEITPVDFGTKFAALQSVAPMTFSALSADTNRPDAAHQPPGSTPAQPDSADNGPEPPPTTDTSFDGSQSGQHFGQDKMAGANGQEPQTPGSNANMDTARPPPSPAEPPQATTPPPASTLPPPPQVIQSGSNGNGNDGPQRLKLTTISAADGYVLAGAAASGERFGFSLTAPGDNDLDGVTDFIVVNNMTAGNSTAYAFEGTGTAAVNTTIIGAARTAIDSVGDFDGDGAPDYVAGNPLSDNIAADGGSAIINFTGTLLISGLNANDEAGRSVAGIGDINGDGYNDVLIGIPGRDNGGGANDGSALILFGNDTPGPQTVATTGTSQLIDNTTDNQFFGVNVASAGDFNNDGRDDFMVAHFTGPLSGEIRLFYGDNNAAAYNEITDAAFTFTGIGSDGTDIPLFNMGDLNGDGISDIAIADTNTNRIHVLFGGGGADTNLADGVNSNGFTLVNSGPGTLESGAFAGDFNGDGIDDSVIALRHGTQADIFVLYGRPGLSGTIDVQDLHGSPGQAFHMTYDIGNTAPFDFTLSTAGDLDGDGFDDLLVGTPDENSGDGAVTIVYGRNDDARGADGQQTHIAGQTTALDDVIANGNGQHLIGNGNNNILDANGFLDVTFRGGSGEDLFRIENDNFRSIDGGTGSDKIEIFGAGTIDFSAFGSEALSGVETLSMMGTGQTMTLGLDDIFRLMQDSQDVVGGRKVLQIADLTNGDGSGTTTLNIIQNQGGTASTFTGGAAGFTGDVGDIAGGGVTYDQYNFGGGYALLIDQNIDAVNIIA